MLDETDRQLDVVVRLPADEVVKFTRDLIDSINADESADFAQRMVYLEWFLDRFNEAIARRDANETGTRH